MTVPGGATPAEPVPMDLLVQACDDYLTTLSAWPTYRPPTLLWAPSRSPMWLGPVVGPGAACPQCLLRRLQANEPPVGHAWGPWRSDATTAHRVPAEATAALHEYLAAVSDRPARARQLWTIYPDRTFRHQTPTDASCPTCGDPDWWARASTSPPTWRTRSKVLGSHRVRTAADSWELLRHHVSPVTGVVTRLSGGSSGPLAGWGARHPTGPLGRVMRTGGKGTDSAGARVAAVCEAVERTALMWPGDAVPVTRASLAELGERAIDPRDIMLFSDTQYAAARKAPTPGYRDDAVIRHRVPLPLRDDDELEWVPAFPLTPDALADPPAAGDVPPHLIPAATVWFAHQARGGPGDFDRARIVTDSNGVAAGATAAEAALFGLLEVIERDAVAMWWHLRLPRPAFDLDEVDDAYLREMVGYAGQHGRDLWLLDLTNDISVPVMVAVCPRADGSEVVFGFGAHLDPMAAARSAVAECAQFLIAFDNSPDDRHGLFGEPGRRWWGTRTLDTDPYLRPAPDAAPTPWPPDNSSGTDLGDLATLVDRLAAAGLTAYAVPMSRPDVAEVEVMRIVVPTARSMFPRYAPGRLFDVPARLGWPAPSATGLRLTAADVNPEEIFF